MEETYRADRQYLRHLLREHPAWTQTQLAETIGRSVRLRMPPDASDRNK